MRNTAAAMATLLLLVACGGGEGATPTSTAAEPAPVEAEPAPEAAAPLAELNTIEGTVSGSSGALVAGATLQTDTDGFAEIEYFDGSVTRLDGDTSVEILELTDGQDAVIRLKMNEGRTWHQVQSLSENATYEVETPVATAAVQGTTFFIACPSSVLCVFSAVTEQIDLLLPNGEVVEVEAPTEVTVTPDGIVEQPLSFDAAYGDPWLFNNGELDQDSGSEEPAQIYLEYGVTYAALAGTYDSVGETTRFDCEGPGCDAFSIQVHQTLFRTYVFVVECEQGACGGRATTEYQRGDEYFNENVPLAFDGSAYRWKLDTRGALCFDADGNFYGELDARFDWTLTPTAAEIRDGRYVATEATLDITVVGVPVEPTPPQCGPFLATYSLDQLHAVTRQP